MNDDVRRKTQKVRGNRTDVNQPTVVAVSHGTSLQNLLRIPSVAYHQQAGVTLIDPGIPQTMPLANTQAQTHSQTVIQTHTQIQAQNQRLLESLVHTHIQSETQTNVHCLPQMQTQSQVLVQPQTQTQPQVHSQQHIHPQALTPAQPHVQIQSQQTDAQVHLQTHLQGPSQTPIMHTIADLVHSQIDSDSAQLTAKAPNELSAVRVPITRHQPTNPVNLQDLQSSPTLDLNDIHPSNSHAKFLSAITSLAESNQLNSGTIGVQQGNISLSHALTQQLTNAQILDALMADRVLIATKNNQGQTTVTPVSSVCSPGMDGLSVMRMQGNYTTTRNEDGTATLLPQDRIPSGHNSLLEAQLMNPQISTSQLHLDSSKLETSEASTMSSLISSNKLLNRLLDTTKPHIPSHVAKAAELAHLIPNPTVRTASTTRSGDLDMAFSTSNLGSNPLTTLTRSSAASMCTVTGALRSSSGYGDSTNKTSPTLQLENVTLPSNFQLNNGSLLLSTLAGPNPLQSHQRHFDGSDQALLVGQNAANIEEPQLDGLSNEPLRLFATPPIGHSPSVSNCIVSGLNILSVSSADKTSKKVFPHVVNQTSNMRSVNTVGLTEMLNKSNSILESHSRSQMNLCTKQGLITSTDPMFPSVVTSANSSSTLNVYGLSKPGMTSQDNMIRAKCQVADSRASQQSLADLINRNSSSDIMLSGGTGNLLLGMPETRISHMGDVLLSELHRSDEGELSLSSSLTGAGDDLHSNASTLVTEASLGTGIGADTAALHGLSSSTPLQGLPSPPLPSFSLPNITSDFMVGGISGSKLSSGQGPFPTLLSNLATTSDFDQFLENSNMCIDINSLAESEVSLSTAPGTFAYSPEKQSFKKSSSSSSSDLTFTSALKAATLKNESDEMKLHCDVDLPIRTLEQHTELKSSHVDVTTTSCSSNIEQSSVVNSLSQPAMITRGSSSRAKKQDSQMPNKPAPANREKRKEAFKKNELLVQQVACFKCRLCSFLNQDKGEMVNHMKQLHSQYLSESEESEFEDGSAPKKVKVHIPKRESPERQSTPEGHHPSVGKTKSKNNRKQTKKMENNTMNYNSESESLFKKMITEEEDVKYRIHIKSEPLESVGEKMKVNNEGSQRMAAPEPEIDQNFDDEDTNDSSTTSDSGGLKPKKMQNKLGRPMFSKSTGITKLKKSNPNVKIPEKVIGMRCDVNGCGLRMKSESNIDYHRKCHVGAMLSCQECGDTFGMWCNLAVHLWRQHMIDMELHKCDKCTYKAYSYSKLMNVHYKIHSEERPSLCDICGKRFKTSKQLRSHKSVHMRKLNSPQHQCEKCQRPFSDKRMLRNHMESVHNKVKPFLCNYCGYSTASRSTLKMHMRQHTGEKPFACEKCTYRTADHNSLRRHRMQHSGVRPYRCPYCDYASIQATTFKVHLKDKHPCLAQVDGIVFTCGICKFETIKRDNYLAHVAEHGRGESKKSRQGATTIAPNNCKLQPGTIISTTPVPHVVNIDVESGAVTVETPQGSPFVNTVTVQDNMQVPGQVTMAGDQYIYAAVDSSMLSRVRSGEGVMRISPDVVAIPMSVSGDTGLVYVATSSQVRNEMEETEEWI